MATKKLVRNFDPRRDLENGNTKTGRQDGNVSCDRIKDNSLVRMPEKMLRHTFNMHGHTLDLLGPTFSVITSVILLLSYGVISCHITAYWPLKRP